MRFIPFIIAGATLTLFNVYAYAKPANPIGKFTPYCGGYTEDECNLHCAEGGFSKSLCSEYVQMLSYYTFDLMLTCKPQILFLRVSYYPPL